MFIKPTNIATKVKKCLQSCGRETTQPYAQNYHKAGKLSITRSLNEKEVQVKNTKLKHLPAAPLSCRTFCNKGAFRTQRLLCHQLKNNSTLKQKNFQRALCVDGTILKKSGCLYHSKGTSQPADLSKIKSFILRADPGASYTRANTEGSSRQLALNKVKKHKEKIRGDNLLQILLIIVKLQRSHKGRSFQKQRLGSLMPVFFRKDKALEQPSKPPKESKDMFFSLSGCSKVDLKQEELLDDRSNKTYAQIQEELLLGQGRNSFSPTLSEKEGPFGGKRLADKRQRFLSFWEKSLSSLRLSSLTAPSLKKDLKPCSTVTGFKKFMYNSVKLGQNQLQPGYNRRKFNHSHYNQTLKESSRLSRLYSHLSKKLIKNYCAFALKRTKNLAAPGSKGIKATALSSSRTMFRPIPKMANLLESRVDVILWKNQLATGIRSARQKIRQDGLLINGGLHKKASFQVLAGDVFTF